MIYLQQDVEPVFNPIVRIILLIVFFVGISWIVLSKFYMYFEQLYALKKYKPFFINA